MKNIKKLSVLFTILITFLFAANYASAIGGGISPPTLWKKVGNDVKLVKDTWDLIIGNVEIGGTTTGDVDMGNDLILNIGDAGTDFTAGGGLNLNGDLDVNGTTTLDVTTIDDLFTVTASSNLATTTILTVTITNDGVVSGDWTVSGTSSWVGVVDTTSDVNVGGDLTVSGTTSLDAVSITDLTLSGDLEVAGTSSFTGVMDLVSDLTVGGDFNLTGTTSALTLGGKITGGAYEIEGSAFDINGGDISSATVSGGLTWSSAQDFNSQALTNINIDSGTITGITDLAIADGGTGASDASTARTNLGVAIGSDVQAYDAGLLSIAGLNTNTDNLIYTSAFDTYSTSSLTSAGRAILDDADASAQRTTLGLVIGTDVMAYEANNATTGSPMTGTFDGYNFDQALQIASSPTFSGLALGAGNLTLTGSIADTTNRVTKGWFTDLEVTNAIAGSITGQAGTVATITGLAPDTATTQAAQPNITSLGTLTGLTMGGNITLGAYYIGRDADNTLSFATDNQIDLKTNGTTTMTIDNAGIITKALQPAARAYPSSDQWASTSAWTQVLLGTESFDVNADFSTASSTFEAPVAGKYQVNAQIGIMGVQVLDAKRYGCGIYVNGALYNAGWNHSGVASELLTVNYSDLMNLSASDDVDLYIYHTEGNDTQIDATYTFMSVNLVQ